MTGIQRKPYDTIARITERIVYGQLFHYFSSYGLFSSSQHEFRTNHSTDTVLLSVADRVFAAMDRRDVTLLCILDASALTRFLMMSSAQTQPIWSGHALVRQLSGKPLPAGVSWEPSSQCSLSPSLLNLIGTYEGSALGPLLFTICANNLPLYANGADVIH